MAKPSAGRGQGEGGLGGGSFAIICVGETEAEREAGKAHAVCHDQIAGSVPRGATAANTAIAYEPVWAIGTGKTPTQCRYRQCMPICATAWRMCWAMAGRTSGFSMAVRSILRNAGEILDLSEVDGALVGGASLKAADFLG